MKFSSCILFLLPCLNLAHSDNIKRADSLQFVTEMPYACGVPVHLNDSYSHNTLIYNIGYGDRYFRQVVQGKKEIIPFLIEKPDDTTMTQAHVPYFGGQYTVADAAYTALQEIIRGIPIFELMSMKFDTCGCGYCSYWYHLRENIRNRIKFITAVQK